MEEKSTMKLFCANGIPGFKEKQLQFLEKRFLVFGILLYLNILVKFTNENWWPRKKI